MDDFWQGNIGFRDGYGGKLIQTLQVRYGLKSQAVNVGVVATALPTTALGKRRSMLIQNTGTDVVYIGGSDVTTANGFPLYLRGVIRIDVADDVEIFGIASATQAVRLLEGA